MYRPPLSILAATLGWLAVASCRSSPDNTPPSGVDQTADAEPHDDASPADADAALDVSPPDAAPDASPYDDAQADTSSQDGAGDGPVLPPPDCARLQTLQGDLAAATDDASRALLVDLFVAEVTASDGFPIRCGASVTFLFDKPQGFGAPFVAGDFNGWSTSAAPMTAVAGSWYRVDLDIAPGPNRYLYKFTDGQQWVPDPNARRFGYDQYGEYSLVSGGLTLGHLERLRGIAGSGLAPRDLTLYLPPGYEASSTPYPVLYAHDGQNLFDPSAPWGGWRLDSTIEALLAQNQIRPFLVVGIHNTAERMDEYTHVTDMLSGQTVGGKGEAYFSLITTRIMPLVASHYRVSTAPADTWTMGSSLGGLISLYFGMKHADVFGRVAGLSSTAGWGSIGAHNPTIIELLPTIAKPDAVFYLDSGGDDGGGQGCLDADHDGIEDDAAAASDNYCENLQLRDAFVASGFTPGVDVFHWWEPGAGHNEAAWAARVQRPLQVLASP